MKNVRNITRGVNVSVSEAYHGITAQGQSNGSETCPAVCQTTFDQVHQHSVEGAITLLQHSDTKPVSTNSNPS